MKLDVPTGTTFYWNPYSPKFYTIVQSPVSSPSYSHGPASSDDEGSFVGRSSNLSGSEANSSMVLVDKHHPSSVTPTDDTYNLGWSTISAIRMEKTTDNAICTTIQRFPFKTLTAMVAVIENSPNLFLELCEKERGNVVSHVIAALQGEQCEELVCMANEQILRLSMHQSGCIALTRIYDGANQDQQQAIALALVQHFDTLVCHQYGNFVLSRIVQSSDDSSNIHQFICAQFERADLLVRCLNDKFGSHVFEAFVKSCHSDALFRVCSVLFSDMDSVMVIATSKIANYPLQAALRQMMAADTQHELSRWALATIPQIVADTKFATNINRALGFGRTADRSGLVMTGNKYARAQ